MFSAPEFFDIDFSDGVSQKNDLALQTVSIDGDRQEFEERVDRNDHGQSLRVKSQLCEQYREAVAEYALWGG